MKGFRVVKEKNNYVVIILSWRDINVGVGEKNRKGNGSKAFVTIVEVWVERTLTLKC